MLNSNNSTAILVQYTIVIWKCSILTEECDTASYHTCLLLCITAELCEVPRFLLMSMRQKPLQVRSNSKFWQLTGEFVSSFLSQAKDTI